ncbi:MAG TPA: Xaa-Pro peptidase family protein [Gemmatimonadales bacterium]|nr:Xaa-Pro peptidase family protein [Gemmatimonadales bacterium]
MRVSAQDTFDKAEFAARRDRLMERIGDGIAVVLGEEEHVYPVRFRQSPDLFYLTGLEEPGLVLILNGVSKKATLFAVKRPKFGPPAPTPDLRDATDPVQTYGLAVQPMESFFTFLTFATLNPSVRKLYAQLTPPDNLLYARFEMRIADAAGLDHPVLGHAPATTVALERIRGAVPQLPVEDVSPKLDELRWVKTAYELERVRQSGRIGAAAVAEAIRATRPGMYEYEIAAAAQYVNTRLGARGDAFPPIVPSGPLAPIVHYMDNRRQMQAGELVYIDYGSDYGYYASDITRTWPVSGRFTKEQEKMYRCVLDARNAIIAAMKPGATISSLKDVAATVYARHGYAKEFEESGRYIGHFVGLSVHDVGAIGGPDAEKPFVAGTVFNVEPILEFPDRKIHIRLEDTVVVTDAGAENVTAGVTAEVEPLYALIKQRGVNSVGMGARAAR